MNDDIVFQKSGEAGFLECSSFVPSKTNFKTSAVLHMCEAILNSELIKNLCFV